MKGKMAKLGGRARVSNAPVEEENVRIEYLELTSTDALDQHWKQIDLLRTNFGVVEATGEDTKHLLGADRAQLEGEIVKLEEQGLTVTLKRVAGIDRMRLYYPNLDARLVHKPEEVKGVR